MSTDGGHQNWRAQVLVAGIHRLRARALFGARLPPLLDELTDALVSLMSTVGGYLVCLQFRLPLDGKIR